MKSGMKFRSIVGEERGTGFDGKFLVAGDGPGGFLGGGIGREIAGDRFESEAAAKGKCEAGGADGGGITAIKDGFETGGTVVGGFLGGVGKLVKVRRRTLLASRVDGDESVGAFSDNDERVRTLSGELTCS